MTHPTAEFREYCSAGGELGDLTGQPDLGIRSAARLTDFLVAEVGSIWTDEDLILLPGLPGERFVLAPAVFWGAA
jgi:hypothetical protein